MITLLIVFLFVTCYESSKVCQKIDDYCYCDKKCSLYGDCCPGNEYFGRKGSWDDIITCRSWFEDTSILLIDKCRERNHRLEDLCTKKRTSNNLLNSLLAVITDDGDLYQNKFCAKCNNERKYKVVDTNILCPGQNIQNFGHMNDLVNRGHNCTFTFQPPFKKIRYCHNDFVRSCPTNYKINQKIADNCQKRNFHGFESVMVSGSTMFRNSFCCLCWNRSCKTGGPRMKLGETPKFAFFLNFNEWTKHAISFIDDTNSSGDGNQTIETTWLHIADYMSIVFAILSLVSLVALIIIYARHSVFHNFGGYLTICLGSCLLLLNALYLLLKIDYIVQSQLCQVIGIVHHYIALGTFIWMSIYALDLMQTFVFKSQFGREIKSLKTFLLYCVAAFGFDAIFIGAACVTEFYLDPSSAIRPSYGGMNCWFTSKIGGIIWYFVPLCILLVWNSAACVIVIFKIFQTTDECKVARERRSKNMLWLCIRLTAVFGIVYMMQIFAVLSKVQALIVIGALLDCLQGFFLAICFLWTKRVHTVVTSSLSSTSRSRSTLATKNLLKDNGKAKLESKGPSSSSVGHQI